MTIKEKLEIYLNEETKRPEVVYLIGLPASGKSTWIRKNVPNHIVVSNDEIVEKYAKKWGVNYNEAWNRLDFKQVTKETQDIWHKAISSGKDIVIDNTNMTSKARKKYDAKGYKKIAVVFNIDQKEWERRVEKRASETGKRVPDEAIANMRKIYQTPTKKEGFEKIIQVK